MKSTHMLFLDLNNSFVIYPCDILIAKKITHGPWLTWVGKENTIKEGGWTKLRNNALFQIDHLSCKLSLPHIHSCVCKNTQN